MYGFLLVPSLRGELVLCLVPWGCDNNAAHRHRGCFWLQGTPAHMLLCRQPEPTDHTRSPSKQSLLRQNQISSSLSQSLPKSAPALGWRCASNPPRTHCFAAIPTENSSSLGKHAEQLARDAADDRMGCRYSLSLYHKIPGLQNRLQMGI